MSSFSNKSDLEKKNAKILRSYKRHFNLTDPYKVIIGPYFCQSVAEKRISLLDGIKSVFLDRDCELYTTKCCINELQKLIDKKQSKFVRGAHILRTLKLLPCLHSIKSNKHKNQNTKRWKCIDAIQCIQFYVNAKTHCFALQPRSYLGRVRSKSGIPSIWMHQSTMILDKLSSASQDFIKNNKTKINQTNDSDTSELDNFLNDEEEEDVDEDIDLNYDINDVLELDDEQNNDGYIEKQRKRKKTKTKPKYNKSMTVEHSKNVRKRNGYRSKDKGENRIRYGPHGGFDTMGMFMPPKKKQRTRRNKRLKTSNNNKNTVTLNDKNYTGPNNQDNEMSITKSQKNMSNWWKN